MFRVKIVPYIFRILVKRLGESECGGTDYSASLCHRLHPVPTCGDAARGRYEQLHRLDSRLVDLVIPSDTRPPTTSGAMITMSPTANRVSHLDVLLRLPRRVARWVFRDETTVDAEREAAARYRAVVEAPIPKKTRLRVEREIRMGTRPVVHLRRAR